MREIKFRIWKESEEINGEYKMEYSYDFENLADFFENPALDRDEECMQYTGLKDTREADIYEGDVLRYRHEYCGEVYGVVNYFAGAFFVTMIECGHPNEDDEVIGFLRGERTVVGNIHEMEYEKLNEDG